MKPPAVTFNEAFDGLIGNEGAYVFDPRDPGGETHFGISRRTYPNEDIRGMTLTRARQIYLRDFWRPACCDLVPSGVRFDLFDMAVNSGVKTATKTLQRALGVAPDGILGVVTLAKLDAMDPTIVVARFNGARLLYVASLSTWDVFGRGWANRIGQNLLRL